MPRKFAAKRFIFGIDVRAGLAGLLDPPQRGQA
jgi:hypothetical protein